MNVRAITAAAVGALALAVAPCGRGDEDATQGAQQLQARLPAVPGREATINFSFDQVAIPTFARLVGEITGRKIVVAEEVQGKVTVISPKIPRDEAYSLFVSILESSGCSVIEEGGLVRVVAMAERPSLLAPVVGTDEATPSEGIVTKVFRLQHVPATDVRKMLEPKVRGGRTGAVGVIEETNHLVVTDTAESIRRIAKIVAEIDQPGLSRVTEIVPLQFAAAESIAKELNDTFDDAETRAEQLRRRLPVAAEGAVEGGRHALIVPSPHANSLLLVGTSSQIEELKGVIAKMDVDAPTGRGRLNAIFLKYIKAEDAAKNLKALLGRTDAPAAGTPGSPAAATVAARRDIAIEPSPENNALLVDANPGDFEVVRKLVEQLDRVTEQVHIEVLIAEVSDGTGLDLGVDMAALDLPGEVGDYAVQGASTLKNDTETLLNTVQNGIFPSGLTVGVAHGTRVDSEGNVVVGYPGIISISAVKQDTRFKIRSNPSLVAQNNQEASVSIVNQIPILTSTIQGGSGTSRDVIQNIERVDVGIKLKLTPHVIPGGEVRMELNPSIEAVTNPGSDAQGLTPTIARREVSTTVTVRDGQVIVIAGLTREDESKSVRKIPILGSIPLIGWLFRHTVESTEKTNVLIFVTPTIVSDEAVATRLMKRASEATGLNYHDDKP